MNGAYGDGIAAVSVAADFCSVAMWLTLWIATHAVMLWVAHRGRDA